MSKSLIPTTTILFPLTLKPHILIHLSPSPNPTTTLFFLSSQNPLRMFSSACTYTRRGTTAEDDDVDGEYDLNWRTTTRRSWWSDVATEPESSHGFVQELLDSIWIFKVFRFYGWWLPPVFISMLLATGLKAFLLALAVPVGLSIVALPINKLWGIIDDPKREKAKKKKKKPRVRTKSNIDIDEEWASDDEGKRNEGGEDSSSFKGWDELDRTKECDEERMRRPARGGRSRREGRFIRRERGGKMSSLLRDLIAVFPFLGWWTKML